MKLYHTKEGVLIARKGKYYLSGRQWDDFINADHLHSDALDQVRTLPPVEHGQDLIENALLPPVGRQEVWAAGVTYFRSREARMEESKDAGSGDFYDRVYESERPELFFKSPSYRVVGHGQKVRIRRDSAWNVPEPELTLVINSGGRIVGYTIGNDMSSRDIEGENPLYLPQAKCYDGSTAVGPCVLLTDAPLPRHTKIALDITRGGSRVFSGSTAISRLRRGFAELVGYLYRETTFPHGCLLMTGTGIVPPDVFTLHHGDVIEIMIDGIGTLRNIVE